MNSELENSAVSHERRSVARARIQARGGWDHCQPVDPVGLLQARRRLGWLSPGVAPRPRRDRRGLHRDGRSRAGQACVALPTGDARTGRPLVAEHVAGRHAVLARHSDGRNGPPHSPGGSGGASGRHRHQLARRVVANGASGGCISRAQWSRKSARSLGGRAGILPVYHRDRGRRAPRRGRSSRRRSEQDRS